MKTVTSRRILNRMEKAGHIAPVPEHCRPKKEKYYYVNEIPGKDRKFEFEGKKYQITYNLVYCAGCFFPFVEEMNHEVNVKTWQALIANKNK